MSAANGPKTASRKFGESFWLFVICLGCSAPISMSARQNTYQYTANRMVHAGSPGQFPVKRSGDVKVGCHGRILGRIFGFVGFFKFEHGFRHFDWYNQSQHPGDVFERISDLPGGQP